MGKSKCAKSPISYLTTAPPEFETSKLLLKAVALAYSTPFPLPRLSINKMVFFFVCVYVNIFDLKKASDLGELRNIFTK